MLQLDLTTVARHSGTWLAGFLPGFTAEARFRLQGAILTLCPSTQAYVATKSEMGQQMSPSELSHPVPLSFEPVKNFFKEFMEAIRDTLQTPVDTRLKESELPNDGLGALTPCRVERHRSDTLASGRKG